VTTYVVLGLFAGAIYALAALGIVLTYKTSGIFNFAYGGVAMFCAYAFWQLRDQWGISQWFSLPLTLLVVAPVMGLLLEAIFRPLATAAVEVQIVVALAILSLFMTLVPIVFGSGSFLGGRSLSDHNLTTIFPHSHFKLGRNVIVTWNELGTFIVAVALSLALYVLLRRTRLGTATRAVVDNRELAGLIAVNAGTVGQVAWIASTIFAAVSGILLSTQEGLVVYVLPALVIYAFAPAVFGRLTSLPLAFAGALALGLIQNILAKYNSTGFIAKLEGSIPYLALFVLLVAYGNRLKEVRSSLRGSSRATTFGRERFGLEWGLGAAVLAAVVFPLAFSGSILHSLAEAMAFAIVALTVVVLTGWTGQISIAQMSFAGVGAFTMAHVAAHHGGLFVVGLLAGALISIPLGLLVGLPSLRLSGLFLALATMAFALLMDNLVFADNSVSGGLTGLSLSSAALGPLSFKSPTSQFFLCLVVLTAACAGVYLLRRGPIGRRLNMVRDSPAAASTLGASLTQTKLAVFAGGAVLASIGGGLLAVVQQTADPGSYSFNNSLELLLVVVVGGRNLVSGAIVAGALDLVNVVPGVPAVVHQYLPLGIAMFVLGIAKGSEGLLQNAAAQARFCTEVLYRLPRPWQAEGGTRTDGAPRRPGRQLAPAPHDVTSEMPALSVARSGRAGRG
jgi:branched-chain amino acid transport system permease protein